MSGPEPSRFWRLQSAAAAWQQRHAQVLAQLTGLPPPPPLPPPHLAHLVQGYRTLSQSFSISRVDVVFRLDAELPGEPSGDVEEDWEGEAALDTNAMSQELADELSPEM